MDAEEAKAALRAANWAPGVSTHRHPHRDEIKAALRVLRYHGIAVESLELVYVPPAPPSPLAPAPAPAAKRKR